MTFAKQCMLQLILENLGSKETLEYISMAHSLKVPKSTLFTPSSLSVRFPSDGLLSLLHL